MESEKRKEKAAEVFELRKDLNKVFVTSDGQVFALEAQAKNHAAHNRSGKELQVETHFRPAEPEDENEKKKKK